MKSPPITPSAGPDVLQLALQRPAVAGLDDVHRAEAELPDPLTGIDSTYALLGRGAARGGEAKALSFFLQAAQFQRPFTWLSGHLSGRQIALDLEQRVRTSR
jgi:hypothetical protein